MVKSKLFSKTEEAALLQKARDDFTLFTLLITAHDEFKLLPFTRELLGLGQLFEDSLNAKYPKKGLIVAAPPRSGKSRVFSQLFVAWHLGRHPDKNIALVSYGEERSIDNTRAVRAIIQSKVYKSIFPEIALNTAQKAKQHFQVTKGGEVMAIGRFSPITGRTMHLIILDDIVKDANEAHSESIRRMIDNAMDTLVTRITVNTRVIAIGTRWYKGDIIDRFYDMAKRDPKRWIVAKYPAIALEDEYSVVEDKIWRKAGEAVFPMNLPVDELEQIKKTVAPHIWEAVYQQSPPSEETYFQRNWIQYIKKEEVEKLITRKFLAIDPAFSTKTSADRTGFAIAYLDTAGNIYLEAWGERLTPKALADKIFALHEQYNFERIGMEKFAFSEGLKPFLDQEALKRNIFLPIKMLSHSNRSKEARILGALPALYAAGKIYHIENRCDLLEQEMFSFPGGEHDDVLDATSYVIALTKNILTNTQNKPKINYGIKWA